MSSTIRLLVLFLLSVVVAVPFVSAQPGSDPTAADVTTLREKFQAERAEALKAKFPVESLARADELLKRADEAVKEENYKSAARYIRDARWMLPYLTPGLPPHITRVLGESRMRHSGPVNSLSFSSDGKYLVSASRDFTSKVWDLSTGREITTYRGHIDQPDDPTKTSTNVLGVTEAVYHPSENIIASASGNQIHTWEPATGKQLKTLLNLGKTEKPIKSIAYSPDGKLLAVGGDDGILRVIESETGKAIYTSPSRNARIERVAFSPNGKLVAIGDHNMQVAVYVPEGKGNQLAMSIQGVDLGPVHGVAFTADSASVFTCGLDGRPRLTAGPTPEGGNAPNTATKLRDYPGHVGAVKDLAVSSDGAMLVTGGDDKSVRIWDVKSGKPMRTFMGHISKLTTVAVRGDGRQVASGSEDGAIRIWDVHTSDDHRTMTDSKDSLWAVAISPDGKRLAAAGADKKIRIYNPVSGKLETTLDAGAAMTSLAFLPDSKRLAAGGGDKKVKIWDIDEQKAVKELTGHSLAVLAVAVSDDGKLLVSGSADSSDRGAASPTLRGFEPNTGKELWQFSARKAACGISIRKGGKEIAVGLADGSLIVLDVTGAAPKEISTHVAHVAGVAGVAYSHDGTKLASVGGDGSVRIWSVTDNGSLEKLDSFDGQPSSSASATNPLSGVAFSPDNRYVAAAGADSVVRVWDVQTKSEIRGLRGHTDWVTSVCFTPDGRFVATVAAEKDNTLRVFELPSLDTTSGVGGHLLAINAVAISSNGKLAATASLDQNIKIWDIESGKEVGTLIGNADIPNAIGFLENNNLVMGGSAPTRDSGRLHYWATTPPRQTKSVATGEVYTLISSPDGTKIAVWAVRPAVGESVKNNAYELYDSKGELLGSYSDKGRNVQAATFTADLAWAVAGDDTGGVQIFDLANKERIGGNIPMFERRIADIGISPDKKFLVGSDDEGTIKVGELNNGKLNVVAKGKAHKGGVRALYVSPKSTTFFTISNDRELKLWSLTDLKPESLTELRSWTVPVTVIGAAYTPDGKSIVTANADGTAYVLELP